MPEKYVEKRGRTVVAQTTWQDWRKSGSLGKKQQVWEYHAAAEDFLPAIALRKHVFFI